MPSLGTKTDMNRLGRKTTAFSRAFIYLSDCKEAWLGFILQGRGRKDHLLHLSDTKTSYTISSSFLGTKS